MPKTHTTKKTTGKRRGRPPNQYGPGPKLKELLEEEADRLDANIFNMKYVAKALRAAMMDAAIETAKSMCNSPGLKRDMNADTIEEIISQVAFSFVNQVQKDFPEFDKIDFLQRCGFKLVFTTRDGQVQDWAQGKKPSKPIAVQTHAPYAAFPKDRHPIALCNWKSSKTQNWTANHVVILSVAPDQEATLVTICGIKMDSSGLNYAKSIKGMCGRCKSILVEQFADVAQEWGVDAR